MDDQPDWMQLAAESGLTPAQAAQEARTDDLADAGIELLRQFAKLRQSARRLLDDGE